MKYVWFYCCYLYLMLSPAVIDNHYRPRLGRKKLLCTTIRNIPQHILLELAALSRRVECRKSIHIYIVDCELTYQSQYIAVRSGESVPVELQRAISSGLVKIVFALSFTFPFNMDSYVPMANYSHVFQFEADFDLQAQRDWFQENWYTPYLLACMYLISIFVLRKKYMQNRERYELQTPLVIWNILLASFSIVGACRTIPELFYVLNEHGFIYSACTCGPR